MQEGSPIDFGVFTESMMRYLLMLVKESSSQDVAGQVISVQCKFNC